MPDHTESSGTVPAGFLDRLRRHPRFPTAVALAALAGLLLVFYCRLWLPDYVLVRRDAFRFFPPIKQYMAERLLQGQLPEWFPYEGLGRPFAGVPVTGVWHPFSLLYLFFTPHDAYRFSALLSCLAGAAGAYALSRVLGVSRVGAVIAGLALGGSGYAASLTENVVYLYSLCMLPWFCAALERMQTGRLEWVAVSAAIWASVFLNGDIQTGYYFGFVAFAWGLLRAPASWQEAARRTGGAALLAALLAAAQLAPSAVVFLGSERSQPERFREQALFWSLHPLRTLSFVAAPLFEDTDEVEVAHRLFGSAPAGEFPVGLWAESLYMGVPVLGLAWLGARRRDLRVLVVLGGLAFVLALGKYGGLYQLFYHAVPVWSAFRYPERLMSVVVLAVAVLAGAGLDRLTSGPRAGAGWMAGALLCAVVAAACGSDMAVREIVSATGMALDLAQRVTESAALALCYGGAAAVGTGLVAAAAHRGRLRPELIGVLMTALIAADLARASTDVYRTGPVELATFTPALVEALQKKTGVTGPGYYRIASLEDVDIFSRERLDTWLGATGITSMTVKQHLDVELNASYRLESFNRYLPGYKAALQTLDGKQMDQRGAARYNVGYYIGRSSQFRHHPRFQQSVVAGVPDFDLVLFRNPAPAKLRVYLSLRPEEALAPVDPSALLARPDYLSGQVDVIESDGLPLPPPSAGGTAVVERYEPEQVRVRVDTPQPAVLILLDAYDDGWTAVLDRTTDLRILRANGLVRAVVVPAGSHQVTFVYRAPLLRAGMAGSLAGAVFCAGLLGAAAVRRRRESRGVPEEGAAS